MQEIPYQQLNTEILPSLKLVYNKIHSTLFQIHSRIVRELWNTLRILILFKVNNTPKKN